MVHITYQHGPDSNEEKDVILKEIHFYIIDECTHESEDQAFGNAIVEKQNYQYETYQLHDGKESRKIKLVTSQVNC